MTPYPIVLRPILKARVWGGRVLARFGKDLPDGAAIGESWELADLPPRIPDGRSVIDNGPLAGRTLHEVLAAHAEAVMGRARLTADGGFPLLIKLLDAQENLSVQVHPPATYVREHAGVDLKTEAWIVLDAAPGAVIYKGLVAGVTPDRLAEDIRTGAVVDDLVAVPARPGACHYLPSGTCHALGAGVLVAEVQTPSDTTFRVYDWGRTGRALHVNEALACIDFGTDATEDGPSPEPILVEGLRTTRLLDAPEFGIERVEALRRSHLPVVTDDQPLVWMVTAGVGRLIGGDEAIELAPGVTVLLPAALADATARLEAGCEILAVSLPPPTRGLLA